MDKIEGICGNCNYLESLHSPIIKSCPAIIQGTYGGPPGMKDFKVHKYSGSKVYKDKRDKDQVLYDRVSHILKKAREYFESPASQTKT